MLSVLLRSLIFNILFFGATTIMAIVGLPVLAFPERVVGTYARLWARMMQAVLPVTGIRHRVVGTIPQGQFIFAAKHQSLWETLVLYDMLDRPAPVFKRALGFIPLVGLYFLRAPAVAIDRSAGVGALHSLESESKRVAARGHSMMIFPQGTRVAPGAHRRYRSGVFTMYKVTGLPVVPIALNSGLFWGRETFLKKPGEITVQFLPPIPPGLSRKAFMARLEKEIETATNALPGMASHAKKE